MNNNYITVGQLNNYLKRKFEADGHLEHVFIKGEISNSKLHSRGHLYFSLKDETSVISAIMFAGNVRGLNFEPKEGTKVFAEGKVTIYEATGKYQIIIDKMQQDGIGALYIAYEKLKNKLEAEGLFNKEHKRPIPKYPSRIGIVTAPTGAAIRDILSTIKRRYPICETILFPALVQGESAKESIVKCIKEAENYDLDLLIVGRGGGSIEDLWAFNERIVADAIYKMNTPVISAVGHEIDFTISDFVSDLRAPTPTAAAELAVPNTIELIASIKALEKMLVTSTINKLKLNRNKLDALLNSYVLKNPKGLYEVKMQKLDNLVDKLEIHTNNIYEGKCYRYTSLLDKLETLNPIKTLKRGYSITKKDGKIININKLKKDDVIETSVNDGIVTSKVMEVSYGKEN